MDTLFTLHVYVDETGKVVEAELESSEGSMESVPFEVHDYDPDEA